MRRIHLAQVSKELRNHRLRHTSQFLQQLLHLGQNICRNHCLQGEFQSSIRRELCSPLGRNEPHQLLRINDSICFELNTDLVTLAFDDGCPNLHCQQFQSSKVD